MSNWKIWKEIVDAGDFKNNIAENDKEIQPNWWNTGWIPFTDNGSGDHICIDLNPTPFGTKGQIIEVWHDNSSRNIVANSFSEWLNDL